LVIINLILITKRSLFVKLGSFFIGTYEPSLSGALKLGINGTSGVTHKPKTIFTALFGLFVPTY
jgi:hypothetical protein